MSKKWDESKRKLNASGKSEAGKQSFSEMENSDLFCLPKDLVRYPLTKKPKLLSERNARGKVNKSAKKESEVSFFRSPLGIINEEVSFATVDRQGKNYLFTWNFGF